MIRIESCTFSRNAIKNGILRLNDASFTPLEELVKEND
jgi:hypothetical protein